MFIKIREDRINVEQINTYLFNDKTKVLTMCFLNDAVRIYHGATQLVQELDRVCNPKELRGLEEEVVLKPITDKFLLKSCDVCRYNGLAPWQYPCNICTKMNSLWETKDEK